ncbi:hypothetical protein NL676_019387 [Syzygium grande]|nr:hypothetical protein NL676_019387 [Syzygium grande]
MYDTDVTTEPRGQPLPGRVHHGGRVVGLRHDRPRSGTHVILAASTRPTTSSPPTKKIFKVDDHIGVTIAGLTADSRVLSWYMRSECINHAFTYESSLPVGRLVVQAANKARSTKANLAISGSSSMHLIKSEKQFNGVLAKIRGLFFVCYRLLVALWLDMYDTEEMGLQFSPLRGPPKYDISYAFVLLVLIYESSPAILYFTAAWCGPCRFMSPAIEALNEKYPHVTTHTIDIDQEGIQDKLMELRIDSVPRLHFFSKGQKRTDFSEYCWPEDVAVDAAIRSGHKGVEAAQELAGPPGRSLLVVVVE